MGKKYDMGGPVAPNGDASGRLTQGQNMHPPQRPGMDEMRRRGRFNRGMSGDTMQTQAPSGPFGGASLYPGMNPGLNPEMRPGMMPPAQPAMPAARPVSTFPDAMPAGANSDMAAFRAARAGGAPMKKGGKVDSYAKGGTVRGWGLARGGRKVKIV